VASALTIAAWQRFDTTAGLRREAQIGLLRTIARGPRCADSRLALTVISRDGPKELPKVR